MSQPPRKPRETLQVLRYDPARDKLRVVVGNRRARWPRAKLIELAAAAMNEDSFVCHTTSDDAELPGDQICLIPRGDHCEVLSIHTDGHHRHYGDHRRGLVEILNDIAAAVARGRLHFLDDRQLTRTVNAGQEILALSIDDSGSLAGAREAVDMALKRRHVPEQTTHRMILCVSEATTNILLHGGGTGTMSLRLLDDRLRAVVADRGPGLDFLDWTETGASHERASMGYGYKLILDNLDEVYLHTGTEGTTLILDHTI